MILAAARELLRMPEWLEKLATTASPALIFAYIWWLERSERKETVRDLKSLSESTVKTLAEFKSMLSGRKGNGL